MAIVTSKGNRMLLVLFILVGIAGAAIWFMRETLEQGAPSLPGTASSSGGAANKTDARQLSSVGSAGTSAVSGQTASSAGNKTVAAGMPSAVPGAASGKPAAMPGTAASVTPPPALFPDATESALPAAEDIPELRASPVQPTFVDDLAVFLVQNYWPRGAHPAAVKSGISTVSLKWANLRYGAEGRGLALSREDPVRGRAAILRYTLKPGVLQTLYAADVERFMQAMAEEADRRMVKMRNAERQLTSAEKKELYSLYAAQAQSLSAAIAAYVADSGMPARVAALASAEQAVYEANTAYIDSMAAHEEVKDSKDSRAVATALQRMEHMARIYQTSIQARVRLRDELESSMGQKAEARMLGGDTLVYCAQWLYRRGAGQEAVLRAASGILADLAGRFASAARK